MTSRDKGRDDFDPHAGAVAELVTKDARLAKIVAHVGACRLGLHETGPFRKNDPFHGLVEAIVSQQLSTKAADTIFGRVKALVGTVDAASILAAPEPRLREAGLSGAKARYVRGIAEASASGELRFEAFATMNDEEVIDALRRIKGIGRWTAEMILMFQLGRLDVLPVGDLGIQKGMTRLYRLRKPPTEKRMHELAKAWRPHRSIASWYLWRVTELSDETLQEIFG